MRRLLDVNGAIFNLIPIAISLEVPEGSVNRIIRYWKDEDGQLDIILEQCINTNNLIDDFTALRKRLESLEEEGKSFHPPVLFILFYLVLLAKQEPI